MKEGWFAEMIATQDPGEFYYLKFDMQRRENMEYLENDDNLEFLNCLGDYHKHLVFQLHLSNWSRSATTNWSELVVLEAPSFEHSKLENN